MSLPATQLKTATRTLALLKAVSGWLVLCTGIGLSVSFARFIGAAVPLGPASIPLIQAAFVTALVVPTILWLRRKADKKPIAGLGLARQSLKPIGIGLSVGLATGVAAWAPGFAAGWIRVENFRPAEVLIFVALNIVLLFFYEAFPEELALRGYAWTSLSEGKWRPIVATLIVTTLFSFSSLIISAAQTISALAIGVEPSGIAIAPAGNDPIAYFLQLFLFGLALVAARRIPIPGALAVAITFHIVQLTTNRVIFGGLGWMDSGMVTTFVEPDAIVLVLVHIILGGTVFLVIRKTLEKRLKRDES